MTKFSDVAARWASGKGKTLTAASMTYRGMHVFSWGVCIALLVDTAHGRVALVTHEKYSTGTSRATNEADAAARKAGIPVIYVSAPSTDPVAQRHNHKRMWERIENAKLKMARSPKPEVHKAWVKALEANKRLYVKHFPVQQVAGAPKT